MSRVLVILRWKPFAQLNVRIVTLTAAIHRFVATPQRSSSSSSDPHLNGSAPVNPVSNPQQPLRHQQSEELRRASKEQLTPKELHRQLEEPRDILLAVQQWQFIRHNIKHNVTSKVNVHVIFTSQ